MHFLKSHSKSSKLHRKLRCDTGEIVPCSCRRQEGFVIAQSYLNKDNLPRVPNLLLSQSIYAGNLQVFTRTLVIFYLFVSICRALSISSVVNQTSQVNQETEISKTVRADNEFRTVLRRLDDMVRRTGRITKNQLLLVFDEVCNMGEGHHNILICILI